MNDKNSLSVPLLAETIRKAFPAGLRDSVDRVLESIPVENELDFPPAALCSGDTYNFGLIVVGEESIQIPYRVYFDAGQRTKLDKEEILLLNCIFSRHHDGFVREDCLKEILSSSKPWIPPYVLILVSGYVLEIVEHVRNRVSELDRDVYQKFANQNTQFIEHMNQRIVTYWSLRGERWLNPVTQSEPGKYSSFAEYPGYLVMNSLGLWRGESAKILLKC